MHFQYCYLLHYGAKMNKERHSCNDLGSLLKSLTWTGFGLQSVTMRDIAAWRLQVVGDSASDFIFILLKSSYWFKDMDLLFPRYSFLQCHCSKIAQRHDMTLYDPLWPNIRISSCKYIMCKVRWENFQLMSTMGSTHSLVSLSFTVNGSVFYWMSKIMACWKEYILCYSQGYILKGRGPCILVLPKWKAL